MCACNNCVGEHKHDVNYHNCASTLVAGIGDGTEEWGGGRWQEEGEGGT